MKFVEFEVIEMVKASVTGSPFGFVYEYKKEIWDTSKTHSKKININIEMIEAWERTPEGLVIFQLSSGRIFEMLYRPFEEAMRVDR